MDARKVVLLSSETLGRGDDRLGGPLMANFLCLLGEGDRYPAVICLLNSGVTAILCLGTFLRLPIAISDKPDGRLDSLQGDGPDRLEHFLVLGKRARYEGRLPLVQWNTKSARQLQNFALIHGCRLLRPRWPGAVYANR